MGAIMYIQPILIVPSTRQKPLSPMQIEDPAAWACPGSRQPEVAIADSMFPVTGGRPLQLLKKIGNIRRFHTECSEKDNVK